jgi:hypothetical protein
MIKRLRFHVAIIIYVMGFASISRVCFGDAPSTQPSTAPSTKVTAELKLTGAAWLNKNDGSSDLLRGLHIEVLSASSVCQNVALIVRKQGTNEMHEAQLHDLQAQRWRDLQKQSAANGGDPSMLDRDVQDEMQQAAIHRANGLHLLDEAGRVADGTDPFVACRECSIRDIAFATCVDGAVAAECKTNIDGKYAMQISPGSYIFYACIDTPILYVEWIIPADIETDHEFDFDNDSATTIRNP